MRQVDHMVFRLVQSPIGDGVVWVRTQVDLDLATVSEARRQLLAICNPERADGRVVVEVTADCFVDVRGLMALVEIGRLLRDRGGTLVLVSPSGTIARVLRVLELADELPVASTLADARRLLPVRARDDGALRARDDGARHATGSEREAGEPVT